MRLYLETSASRLESGRIVRFTNEDPLAATVAPAPGVQVTLFLPSGAHDGVVRAADDARCTLEIAEATHVLRPRTDEDPMLLVPDPGQPYQDWVVV